MTKKIIKKNIVNAEYINLILPPFKKKKFLSLFNIYIFNVVNNSNITKNNINTILNNTIYFFKTFSIKNELFYIEYSLKNVINLSIMNIFEKKWCQTFINYKLDILYF